MARAAPEQSSGRRCQQGALTWGAGRGRWTEWHASVSEQEREEAAGADRYARATPSIERAEKHTVGDVALLRYIKQPPVTYALHVAL